MTESWKTFIISISGVLIGGLITFGTSYYILQGEAKLERERLASQEKNIIYQTNHQNKVENYSTFSFSYDKLLSENDRLFSIVMDLGNKQMAVGNSLEQSQLEKAHLSYKSLCDLTQKEQNNLNKIYENIVKEHEQLHKSFYILLTYMKDKKKRELFQARYHDIWKYLTIMAKSVNSSVNEINFFIRHYSNDIKSLQQNYQKRIFSPEFQENLANQEKMGKALIKFEKSSKNLKSDLYNELFQ